MNYIWDLVIRAEQSGLSKKDIEFVIAQIYSPYMELSYEMLNAREVQSQVEINPYYRFHNIFRDLFDVNFNEDTQFRNALFDLLIHFLADIDRLQGMNKREYYIKFVIRELESGIFGQSVKSNISFFSKDEKELIAHNILRLYETGDALFLLKDTMRKIFNKSIIYAHCEERDELIFFIAQEKTEIALGKVTAIKDIFLPVRFSTEFYWNDHFGIIGVDEAMKVDKIALY